MKKYLSHIIYILIIAFFITFANIKANEAEKQRQIAQDTYELAEEAKKEAVRLATLAKEQATNAEKQAELARQAIEDCENSKKH